MKLKDSLMRIVNAAEPTLRRFWVSVGLTIALTITLMRTIVGNYPSNDSLVKCALALIPAIFSSWCAILFWERQQRRETRINSQFAANLIAIPAAGLVVAATYLMLGDLSMVSLSRHAAISLFIFLAFFVIPHFRKEGTLEMYVVKLFAHAVVSVLFSAVMFGGLSAITFTVSSLFSLDLSYKVYIRIWLTMAGILAPFLFMAGIPRGTVNSDAQDYPKVLKSLGLFVITPLLTAYTLVLYLYFAKILVSRQWPVGLVSHLVLWYSVVSAALLFFIWPLSSTNKWGDAFSKYFPKAVIPLLLMMFASVGIRIQYYGITENRYYVLVLGLWVLGAMIYLVFTRARKSLVLPASLAIVVVLSVFGPWSSFSISKWSQNQRLEDLLTKYGMLQEQAVVPTPNAETIPLSDRQEIAEILFYFDRNHTLADAEFLPPDFKMAEFESVFGFDYAGGIFPKPREYSRYEAENQVLDIREYQYLFDYTNPTYEDGQVTTLDHGNVSASYDRESHEVAVTLEGNLEWELSLAEYVSNLKREYGEAGRIEFLPEDMVLTSDTATLRVKVVITSLGAGVAPENEEASIDQLWFFLLVGEK